MNHPLRTCVGCRAKAEPSELSRYVLRDGKVVADQSKCAPGRGAWVHPDEVCLTSAQRGGFARSFRTRVES
ncbi:YlxR family protein [Propionimicrobium lymphophilum]|uniref:YlxR family protein n=1 Tax=Propionimicrobium TaxID=203133 RepID=UPI0009DC4074|nr:MULTISPECIES: YlxR family protein [Propionimicrobium]MDK7709972.1 YlxR family protein [Propionimicrobium lymphophilum]MDK7732779.1 YlxR family protein [Propionimicrobium lymphophilum]